MTNSATLYIDLRNTSGVVVMAAFILARVFESWRPFFQFDFPVLQVGPMCHRAEK